MADRSDYEHTVHCGVLVAKYRLFGTMLAETNNAAQKFFSQIRSRIMQRFPTDETVPFAILSNRDVYGGWRFNLIGMNRKAVELNPQTGGIEDPYPYLSDIRLESASVPGFTVYLHLDVVIENHTEFTFFGNDWFDDVDITKLDQAIDSLFLRANIASDLRGTGIELAKKAHDSRSGMYFWMVHNWFGATYPRDMVARVALSRWMGHPVDGNWTSEKLANELSQNFGEDSCIIYINDAVSPAKNHEVHYE